MGNALIAVANYLGAQSTGGELFLRIEDTDARRSKGDHAEDAIQDLQWLGLHWEGEPIRQSDRHPLYREVIKELLSAGHAYRFPDDQVFLRMPPGTVAELNDGAVGQVRSEFRPAHGFRGATLWRSLERGSGPTFLLANTVDDWMDGVTHVVRGDDHLTNTSKQLFLQTLMGWPHPHYFHVGRLLGNQGERLSKRNQSESISDFRNLGVDAIVVVNHLARLLQGFSTDETLDWETLAGEFDLSRLSTSPARFDTQRFRRRQRTWVRQQPLADLAAQFARWNPKFTQNLGPLGLEALIDAGAARGCTFHEMGSYADSLVYASGGDPRPREELTLLEPLLPKLREALGMLPEDEFSFARVEEVLRDFNTRFGVAFGSYQTALRWMLSGYAVGLPLHHTMAIIGRHRTLERLNGRSDPKLFQNECWEDSEVPHWDLRELLDRAGLAGREHLSWEALGALAWDQMAHPPPVRQSDDPAGLSATIIERLKGHAPELLGRHVIAQLAQQLTGDSPVAERIRQKLLYDLKRTSPEQVDQLHQWMRDGMLADHLVALQHLSPTALSWAERWQGNRKPGSPTQLLLRNFVFACILNRREDLIELAATSTISRRLTASAMRIVGDRFIQDEPIPFERVATAFRAGERHPGDLLRAVERTELRSTVANLVPAHQISEEGLFSLETVARQVLSLDLHFRRSVQREGIKYEECLSLLRKAVADTASGDWSKNRYADSTSQELLEGLSDFQEAIWRIAGRTEGTDETFALDEGSLAAFLAWIMSGCLEPETGTRRWGLAGIIADGNARIASVQRGGGSVYRGIFRTWLAELPALEYRGHVLWLENAAPDGGGDDRDLDLLVEHVVLKSMKMAIPIATTNNNGPNATIHMAEALRAAAKRLGLRTVEKAKLTLLISRGHLPAHHSDNLINGLDPNQSTIFVDTARGQERYWHQQSLTPVTVVLPPSLG